MRKIVAARLTEAKQTIPHFYLTLDCKIDALLAAREQINAAAPLKDGKPTYKLSVNDFVMKAWARGAAEGADWPTPPGPVDSILYHKHVRRRGRGGGARRPVHAGGQGRRDEVAAPDLARR